MLDLGLPLKVVALDANGGYDTHDNQNGSLPGDLAEFSQSLAAFQADLEARGLADRVLINVWSEFGRRPQENGSGTDHGAAGPLDGHRHAAPRARWSGEFPGLATLDEDDNLRNTTDFRAVYCSLLEQWLGVDADGDHPQGARPSRARCWWAECRFSARLAAGRRCLIAGLLCVSAGPRWRCRTPSASPRRCKKKVARTSAVARPTPIRARAGAAASARRSGARSARPSALREGAGAAPRDAERARGAPGAPGRAAARRPREPCGARRRRLPSPSPTRRRRCRPRTRSPIQVLSGEFFLQLSKPEVHAGNVRVEFNNSSAEDPHDLHLVPHGRHGRELRLRRAAGRRGRGEDAEAQRGRLAAALRAAASTPSAV